MTSAHGGTGAAAEAGVHNPRRSDITDHPNTGKESQNEESVMDYRKESMERSEEHTSELQSPG